MRWNNTKVTSLPFAAFFPACLAKTFVKLHLDHDLQQSTSKDQHYQHSGRTKRGRAIAEQYYYGLLVRE